MEIARAVSAVHAAGLLHRDIKAQNVTRSEDGRIVLMDFGAGSELGPVRRVIGGRISSLCGTGGPGRARSDLAERCLQPGSAALSPPNRLVSVQGRTVRDVREVHEGGERVLIRSIRPEIRPRLARAIERACDPRPERRYESADALARELLALRRGPWRIALPYGLAAAAVGLAAVVTVSEVRARFTGEQGLGSRILRSFNGERPALASPIIAVLPFKDVSSDAAGGLLVDNITVGLIRELAVIEGLQVKSSASSFMLRNRPRN